MVSDKETRRHQLPRAVGPSALAAKVVRTDRADGLVGDPVGNGDVHVHAKKIAVHPAVAAAAEHVHCFEGRLGRAITVRQAVVVEKCLFVLVHLQSINERVPDVFVVDARGNRGSFGVEAVPTKNVATGQSVQLSDGQAGLVAVAAGRAGQSETANGTFMLTTAMLAGQFKARDNLVEDRGELVGNVRRVVDGDGHEVDLVIVVGCAIPR